MKRDRPCAGAGRGITCLLLTVVNLCACPIPVAADLRAEAVTYYEAGQKLLQDGEVSGAMTSFQKSAGLDPGYAEPYAAMGALYERRGQFQLSQRAYDTALARQPQYLPANVGIAALYERMGQQASALAYWLKAGVLAQQQNDLTQAAKALERALALDPENLETYTNLARVYERTGRNDDARSFWLKLGLLAEAQGDLERAARAYEQTLALDPNNRDGLRRLGLLYERVGAAGKAKVCWLKLAALAKQGSQPAEAEEAYERILGMAPSDCDAHANLAMLAEQRNQDEDAVDHWIACYRLGDPLNPWMARAEERLVSLGVLRSPRISRSLLVAQEMEAHQRSLEEFKALTTAGTVKQ